jgi:hypothetical protein
MESEDISNIILANAFRTINRPYLALIGLVINLICFYKHWSYRQYLLDIFVRACYQFVFSCIFITIALDHFAVQVFLERYFSQKRSCQLLLVVNDIIFCSNLSVTIIFLHSALKMRCCYAMFMLMSVVNCTLTMHSLLTAPPVITEDKNALICGFATSHSSSNLQLVVDSVLLFCIFPIFYKLHFSISKRYSSRTLSFWCQMLSFSALTLIAVFLLAFHWVVEISSHHFVLVNEIAEFMSRSLGWILLPIFMMCVQFGFLFQTKSAEEIREQIREQNHEDPLEMHAFELFTFHRHLSSLTMRSDV